jgi:hypothetical protein
LSLPELNRKNSLRFNIALFWILAAAFTVGLVATGSWTDNALARQLSTDNCFVRGVEHPSSSLRTINLETRDNTGEGVLDEPIKVVTGFKVEAFSFINRLPSFYRLRSQFKIARNYVSGISKYPNSPLALNQILRI